MHIFYSEKQLFGAYLLSLQRGGTPQRLLQSPVLVGSRAPLAAPSSHRSRSGVSWPVHAYCAPTRDTISCEQPRILRSANAAQFCRQTFRSSEGCFPTPSQTFLYQLQSLHRLSKSLFFFIATVNSFAGARVSPTPPHQLVVRMRARVPAPVGRRTSV